MGIGSGVSSEKGKGKAPEPGLPEPGRLRKDRGGPKKRQSTQGYFCSNPDCEYCGIANENNPLWLDKEVMENKSRFET
jgi:hypothetical protein